MVFSDIKTPFPVGFYPEYYLTEKLIKYLIASQSVLIDISQNLNLKKTRKAEGRVLPLSKPFILSMKFAFKPISQFLEDTIPLHRLVRLRERYVLTRNRRLRMRYVASGAAVCVLSAGLVFTTATSSFALKGPDGLKAENVAAIVPAGGDAAYDDSVKDVLQAHISDGIRKASMALKKPEQPKFKEIKIGAGQTIAGQLQEAGLSGSEAYKAVKALNKHFDVRKVKSGQTIGVHYEPDQDGLMKFAKMEMSLGPVKEVTVMREGAEDFKAELLEKELIKRTYGGKAQIQTSVFGSAARANIPPAVIADVIRIYSWDVDFQRDIRQGDKIEVMYETYETEDGQFGRYGNVLFASLTLSGIEIPIYRFEMSDGRTDYFQPNGRSIKKTLMKTPIDGARMSSGFGMRHHPVLGYNKMHKGVDFAASTGTPIYAAGDGVLEVVGRKGGYGNYIRIRHNSKLKTAYAHMHKFAKGMSKGKRVKQGQVIGYVGTTGRSTGPHLHYEVLSNGKQVNPRSVNLPTGEELAGKEKQRFKSLIGEVKQQYVSLTQGIKFASHDDGDEGSERHIH